MYETRSINELPELKHRFQFSKPSKSFKISDEVLDVFAGFVVGISIASIVFVEIFSNAIEPLIK